MIKKTAKNQCKKLISLQHSVRATYKSRLKKTKIIVFDHMLYKSPDVPLHVELLT